MQSRRQFVQQTSRIVAGSFAAALGTNAQAQQPGDRPARSLGVSVLLPRTRVPVALIIDDSTCLVNLNRYAMPQFDTAFAGSNPAYHRDWRRWPAEIPDTFVRRFGEWCAAHGVRGKYSIVPYPACVGRLDRGLPGWTQRELRDSIELVRSVMLPNWDIHPEMVTHTRVIDLKTGHPHADSSPRFMENWEWTTGRSADEIAAYQVYALNILKEIGLPAEGVTTPGGFGNKALPQLARATLDAVRSVYRAEVPHYFRHVIDRGAASVAPRVELASDLAGDDPRCVVSIVGCTGDWTGGWDCTEPTGADAFISVDGRHGRLVEVIERGEPAMLLAHWTGIYWNGHEHGFKVFQEVVRRLHARFENLHWMKLSEVSRYWAARELTAISRQPDGWTLRAPFACRDFTVRLPDRISKPPVVIHAGERHSLHEVATSLALNRNTWHPAGEATELCFDLPRGASRIVVA